MEKPEEMGAFFDARAGGYDEHMRGYVFTEAEFTRFYQAVAAPIEETDEAIQILDLGCGTGLELEAVFKRAPNAHITGVDLSKNMLALLRENYHSHTNQVTLVANSYLSMEFERQAYDYILSVMSAHHLLRPAKRKLYQKIKAVLKPDGKYIEGDSVTLPTMEEQFLLEYKAEIAKMPAEEEGHYHIDLPFSIDTQRKLLVEAGFRDFELVWQKDSNAVWNAAVYVVSN